MMLAVGATRRSPETVSGNHIADVHEAYAGGLGAFAALMMKRKQSTTPSLSRTAHPVLAGCWSGVQDKRRGNADHFDDNRRRMDLPGKDT